MILHAEGRLQVFDEGVFYFLGLLEWECVANVVIICDISGSYGICFCYPTCSLSIR